MVAHVFETRDSEADRDGSRPCFVIGLRDGETSFALCSQTVPEWRNLGLHLVLGKGVLQQGPTDRGGGQHPRRRSLLGRLPGRCGVGTGSPVH